MTEASAAGGCRCGAVRFAAHGPPNFVANCHCEGCRRATGAAFSSFVGYRASAVRFAPDARKIFESAPGVRRGFCPACGTALSYESDRWPGETHLFLGAFDAPACFTPDTDSFADERLAWVQLLTHAAKP